MRCDTSADLAGEATPSPGSIVMDLKRLQQVVEIDRKNLRATVECWVDAVL